MPFISSISIDPPQRNPYPYDVTAVRHCKNIQLNAPITFLVGDNGTGKSTVLEVIGKKLKLPLINGPMGKKGFEAANILAAD